MPNFKIPAFGEGVCYENQENATARVWSIEQASQLFEAYGTLLSEQGYEQREGRTCGENRYAAWQKGSEGVFINAYGATDELRIVSESTCRYFDFSDRAGKEIFAPQITQVKLDDYGMSYVIRLADGRFILIDGGFIYDSDADALHETLMAQAEGAQPVIAAWILTHQHEDHFHCFLRFMEKYEGEVQIEKFLFNFPAPDDFSHYPELARDNAKLPDSRAVLRIPQLLAWIKKLAPPALPPTRGRNMRSGKQKSRCFLAWMTPSIKRKTAMPPRLCFAWSLAAR